MHNQLILAVEKRKADPNTVRGFDARAQKSSGTTSTRTSRGTASQPTSYATSIRRW